MLGDAEVRTRAKSEKNYMKIVIEDVEGPNEYEMAVYIGDELNPTYLSLHRGGKLKCVSFMAGLERITHGDEKWWDIGIMQNCDANKFMRRVRPLLYNYFDVSNETRAIIDGQVWEMAEPYFAFDQGVEFVTPDEHAFTSITYYDQNGNEVAHNDDSAVECVICGSWISTYSFVSHQITALTTTEQLAEIARQLQLHPDTGYVCGLADYISEIQLTLAGAYRVQPKQV